MPKSIERPRATTDVERLEAEALKRPSYRKIYEETLAVSKVSDRAIIFRGEHKLTQAALAKKSGISRKALNEIECMINTNPTLKTLEGLAKAMKITVSELLA